MPDHFKFIIHGGQEMGEVPRLDLSEIATPMEMRNNPKVAIQ